MENIDLNKLSFEDLQKKVKELKEAKSIAVEKESGWQIGENYLIRTVTFTHVGKLVNINDKEIILEDASWVADTGRFHDSLSNGLFSEDASEIEPFVDEVIINRSALVDATRYRHELPTKQK